jgi:hypothetical protein
MPTDHVETYHRDGSWRNRIADRDDLPGVHLTREAAIEVGRGEAREREVEHLIHHVDGSVDERVSYRPVRQAEAQLVDEH